MKDAPDEYLMAFQRLLAPRPIVYVFPDLKGYWYAATELPNTYQVLLAVSLELYRDVCCKHWELTGVDIGNQVTIEFRAGSGTVVQVPFNQHQQGPALNAAPLEAPTMFLEPKYVEPRALQQFRRR